MPRSRSRAQSRCLKCHAIDVKKVGPAWKDVAAKYMGNPGAEDKLYKHVTTGRQAKFDDGHLESHPIVKTRDPDRINNLVNWILSLRWPIGSETLSARPVLRNWLPPTRHAAKS